VQHELPKGDQRKVVFAEDSGDRWLVDAACGREIRSSKTVPIGELSAASEDKKELQK
jgi:hypothetical protein